MNQLVMKDCGVLLGCEIPALPPPLRNRRRHPAGELAHARFTFRSASFPVEILRCNDVRCRHRPAFRNFDVFLLKDHLAGFVGDCRGPIFPLDGVVRRNAFAGEVSAELEPFLSLAAGSVSVGFSFKDFLFHEYSLLILCQLGLITQDIVVLGQIRSPITDASKWSTRGNSHKETQKPQEIGIKFVIFVPFVAIPHAEGNETVKQAPLAGPSLSATIVPPCIVTRSFTIARPRPSPTGGFNCATWACLKRSKMYGS